MIRSRTQTLLTVACIAALTLLAWVYLLHFGRVMSDSISYGRAMANMGMPMAAPWTRADLLFTFAMWAVMMVGMMSPAATPVLLVVVRSAVARGERRTAASAVAFAGGYFLVWAGFSAAATLVQWRLHDTTVLSPAMAVESARIGGVILIAAGLYQLTPLKRVCLINCRNPIDFLVGHWRNGLVGAVRMGLHHGAHCLGCCWALMLILFAVGIMNLWWVAALGVFVLLERVDRAGVMLSRAAGVALIAAGVLRISSRSNASLLPSAVMTPTTWHLKGTALIACNCDYGCPCNFNALPTRGFCEGGWTWHVDSGAVDGVALDGLIFTVVVKWPGAIHHGNGEGVILVDERATPEQRDAIAALVSGKFGGPWGVLAWTWPKVHGPKPVAYQVTVDGIHSRFTAGESVAYESTTIKNPVTGHEVHPAMVLPEGLIVKHADLGASKTFTVNDGISFDHSGLYSAVGPFDYAWP